MQRIPIIQNKHFSDSIANCLSSITNQDFFGTVLANMSNNEQLYSQ